MAREYSTIVIYRPDNTPLYDAILTEGSVVHFQLMESYTMRLSFVTDEPIGLTRGCYVDHPLFGRFILGDDEKYKPRYDESVNGYQYDITFDAFYYDWNRKLYVHNPKKGAHQSTWTLTGDIKAHMEMFVKILNESGFAYTENGVEKPFYSTISYQSGDPKEDIGMPNHDIKTITYDSLHILDALNTICETYETEWYVNGNVIEIGRKEDRSTDEYKDISIGGDSDNCSNMSSSSSKDSYANRIYLFGSTRNIPSRYRKSLVMQVNDISDGTAIDSGSVINLKPLTGVATDTYSHTGVYGGKYNPTTQSYEWDLAWYYPTKTFYKDKVFESKICDFTPEKTADPSLKENRTISISNFEISCEYDNSIKNASARIELRGPSGSVEEVMCAMNTSAKTISLSGTKTLQLRCTGQSKYSLYVVLEYPLIVGTGDISDSNTLLNKYFSGSSKITINDGNRCEVSVSSPVPASHNIVFRDKTRALNPSMFLSSAQTVKDAISEEVRDYIGCFMKFGESETAYSSFSNIFEGDFYYGKMNIIPNFDVSCPRCKSLQCKLVIEATAPTGEVVRSESPSFNESYTTSSYFTEIKYNIYEKLTGGKNPFVMNFDDIENKGLKFHLKVKLEFTAVIDQFVEVVVNGNISIQNLNSCVSTSIKTIPISDGEVELVIPAQINPLFAHNRSDAASYIYISESDICDALGVDHLPDGFRIDQLFRYFTIENTLAAQVPLSYYTDEEAVDGRVMNYKKRLMLNKQKYPNNYMELEGIEESEVVEQVVVVEEIFPKKVLSVVDVETHNSRETIEYDDDGEEIKGDVPHYFVFTAAGEFPFIKEMTYNQEQMKVIFQTGLLAGLEFDINYDSEKDGQIRWEIVSTNNDNFWLPNEVLKPQNGDKLILFNYDPSYMEDLLVASAEAELEEYGKRYLARVGVIAGTINCTLTSDYAQSLFTDDNNVGISIGDKVNLHNPGFFNEGRKSRIIGFDIKLDIPYDSPQIICGESGQYSLLGDYANKIENMSNTAAYGAPDSVGGSGAVGIVQMDAIPSSDTAYSSEAQSLMFLRKNKDDEIKGKLTTNGLVNNGSATFNGNEVVNGNETVNGNVEINGDTQVVGDATFAGKIGSKVFNQGLLGNGWRINEQGHAEMDSLSLRKFLEVPELRYNRTTVLTGVQWHTNGAGIIEDVIVDRDPSTGNYLNSGIVKLKLEDGEVGAVAAADLCMGIYHNEDGGNDDFNYDGRDGNFNMKGFQTIYFKIDYLCDENGDSENPDNRNQYFHYTLREKDEGWVKMNHPISGMNFAAYANPLNATRQCCVYSTTDYTIMLVGMVDWTYNGNNISLIEGNLNGFTIPASKLVNGEWVEYDQWLKGYGLAFGNAYMWGKITQFTRDAYIVTQKPRYFASSESLEVVLSKWNAKIYTKDDFSEDSIEPTSAKPNVYIIFEYTYSNESKSYSDPTLFSMYGVAGKDGKPGAQPNLYGYGTTFIEADSNVIAHHKSSGFVVYRGSKGSYLTINGLNIFPDTDYVCSFNADTNQPLTIEFYGNHLIFKDAVVSRFIIDDKEWYRYVCKIRSGKSAIEGRDFALAFDEADRIIDVQNFKIEKSTEATEYDGLAQDDLTPVNLLHGTGDFNGWTINERYARLWDVGAIGNKAVYVDSHCKEVFLSYSFSQTNYYIKRNRWHILSWYSCSGSITTDASKNYSYVVSIKGLTPDQLITTDGYTHNISTSSFVFSDNNDWVRHYIIFRATAFDSQNIITIEVQRLSSAYSGYFSSPMLELGDKLNHWQPAEIDRKGKDGTNVEISSDGYWVLDGKKTDFSAEGDDGHSPYINGGYWYEWDTDKNQYHNTGIKAEGEDGQSAYSVNLSSDTVTIPLSKDGTLLEIVDYTIYIDAYKGNKRINVKKIDFDGTGPLNKYFFIIVNDDEYTVNDNCIQFYSRPVSFEEFRDISYWCEITVEDEDGVQAIFYRYINFVKNRQGRDGVSPVSLQLDVNTIVFPTMDGNISEGAIERRITAIMLSGTTSFPTSISSATISDNNGLTVRTDGNEVVVTPQVGSAWGNDRTLTIVAAASVKGETIVMTATVNVVESAQGQTVTGPQGASFSGMVEQFQATASNDVSTLVDDAWSNTHIDPTADLPYVWNREIVSIFDPKTSQTTTQMTEPHICCEFADGIVSHSSKYAVNNSNVAPSDAAFDEYGEDVAAAIASMNNTDRRFLWNWEVSEYKDTSKNSSVKRLVAVSGRDGEDGKDGIDGVDGNDGNGILSVSERYSYGTESAPVGTWYTTAIMPLDEDGKRFVWNKEVISYTNGEEKDLVPHIIARYTKDGKGILSYSTTYAVTNTPEVPSSFPYNNLTTAVSHMSSDDQYLWENEITYFTDGTNDGGEIRLISVYGKTGEDGKDGTSVQSISEMYAYGTETQVTGAWTTSALVPTKDNPYVWNKEVITFVHDDGTTETSELTPHIIARYASDGKGIASMTTTYAVTNSNSAPDDSLFIYNDINVAVRQMSADNRYLWELEIVAYTTGDSTKSKRLVTMYGSSGIPGVDGADAVQPNLFGYDCPLSGVNLFSSFFHTDNGIAAYAKMSGSSSAFSVTIGLSGKIKSGHSYAIHGYITSPDSGTLSISFSGAKSDSSVVKDVKTSFYALLEGSSDNLTLKVTPQTNTYAGRLEISELKIEDMTGLKSTKTAYDGLSSYDVPRGENMLRNTLSYDGWTQHQNTTIIKGYFQGQSAVAFGAKSNILTLFLSSNITLKKDTAYTLSWWEQASDTSVQMIVDIQLPSRNGYSVVYSNKEGTSIACPDKFPRAQFNPSAVWTYRTMRFKSIGDVNAVLRFYSIGIATYYISKPKLEEGDCDTEWIESPEDRKGMNGCVVRPRGEWDEYTIYINESESASSENSDGIRYIDVVQYGVDGNLRYYQRNTYSDGYAAGILPTDTRYWTEANMMDFVASKVLMSDEAWVNALTGKSMFVTDSTGKNVTAGIQSVKDNTTPQIFAGASENNANDAKFRVYSDGRVVLENVDINSEDKDKNKVRINDGCVQFLDDKGNIKTTISQFSPASIQDAMPKDTSDTERISTESIGYNKGGYSDTVYNGRVYYTETTRSQIASVTASDDGGVFIIPKITVNSYMYSAKPPTSGTSQGIMSKTIELILNGTVIETKSRTMYLNLSANSSSESVDIDFKGYNAPSLKGEEYVIEIKETTTYSLYHNTPGTQVYIPNTSSNVRVKSDNLSISVSYANYLNKILGNGFVFQSDTDKFFSYINTVQNTEEAMRIGQGAFRLRMKNQMMQISHDGGTTYVNNNPLVLAVRMNAGDSQSKVSVNRTYYNKYNLSIDSGYSSANGKFLYDRNSQGTYSFYHDLGNVAIQVIPYGSRMISPVLTSIQPTYFQVTFYSSGTTTYDPVGFIIYIFEG